MKFKLRWVIAGLLVLGLALAAAFCILVYQRIIILNNPSSQQYPVRGIDVSRYQGEIDWRTLSAQEIDFAYIKATEGSGFSDEKFAVNWKDALQTSLKVGAYHFFSFDSPGESQAVNYINTVGSPGGALPPAVDVEFYGDKASNRPDKKDVHRELKELLDRLEAFYGKKPVIYTTQRGYYAYIKGAFEEYPLWIRHMYYSPQVDLRGKWTFWQYTDQAVLEGYESTQEYIDMNVFCGSQEDFDRFIQQPKTD